MNDPNNIIGLVRQTLGGSQIESENPHVDDWLLNLHLYWIAIGFAIACSIVVIILAGIHLYYVLVYISYPTLQNDLYWIVFQPPVLAICGTMGMLIPRSAAFLYSIGIVYSLVCFFILVSLMTTLHGSREAMCKKLCQRGVKLNLKVVPYTCCLTSLPFIQPTARNFRIIEWFVFQSPIIRIVIEILNLVAYYEYKTRIRWFFTLTQVVSIFSQLIASYASYVLIPAGSKMLTEYKFITLFRILDYMNFIYSLQFTIFTYMVNLNLFPEYGRDHSFRWPVENSTLSPTNVATIINSQLLSATANSHFWACFLTTFEVLFASALVTLLLRPSKSMLFDKYPRKMKSAPTVDEVKTETARAPSPFDKQALLDQEDFFGPIPKEKTIVTAENKPQSPDTKVSAERTDSEQKNVNSAIPEAEPDNVPNTNQLAENKAKKEKDSVMTAPVATTRISNAFVADNIPNQLNSKLQQLNSLSKDLILPKN